MSGRLRCTSKSNSRHHEKKLQEDVLVQIEEIYETYPLATWSTILKKVKEEHSIPVPNMTCGDGGITIFFLDSILLKLKEA